MLLDSTVPAGDALRWAHDASERDQSLSAFRSRLTLYVRMIAVRIAGMYLVGMLELAAMSPASWWEVHSHPSKLVHRDCRGAMHSLITGTPPFEERTLVEICGHHMHTPPTPPSERLERKVPSRLEQLMLRCLAKDPSARPSDRELLALLDERRTESPWRVRAPASIHPPPSLAAHG